MGIILQELGLTGKILIVMTNGSASGVLVASTVPMMASFLWGFTRVFKVDDFHRLSLMELAEGSLKWIPRVGLNPGAL